MVVLHNNRQIDSRFQGIDCPERIVALLPDPKGKSEGNEAVEIANSTAQAVDLAGWKLRDQFPWGSPGVAIVLERCSNEVRS